MREALFKLRGKNGYPAFAESKLVHCTQRFFERKRYQGKNSSYVKVILFHPVRPMLCTAMNLSSFLMGQEARLLRKEGYFRDVYDTYLRNEGREMGTFEYIVGGGMAADLQAAAGGAPVAARAPRRERPGAAG